SLAAPGRRNGRPQGLGRPHGGTSRHRRARPAQVDASGVGASAAVRRILHPLLAASCETAIGDREVDMGSEFRAFLLKSNALALAIGVVFGAALGTVVNSLVKDIILPPIGYALGGMDFADIKTVLAPASG